MGIEHHLIPVDLRFLVTAHAGEFGHLTRIRRIDVTMDVRQQCVLRALTAVKGAWRRVTEQKACAV
jgi:hypothetical protein